MSIWDFLMGIKAREDACKPADEVTEEDLIADIMYWQEQDRKNAEQKRKNKKDSFWDN